MTSMQETTQSKAGYRIGSMTIPQEAFKMKLLDKDHHERLLLDLRRVATVAGIPPQFVWARLSDYCGKSVIHWVSEVRRTESSGMVFVGAQEMPIEASMMAIAGACLRNYIDARVMPVQDVLQHLKDGDMPSPTILLIPNFFLEKKSGGDIPSWQISSLLGLLLSRMGRNQKTVINVWDMDMLGQIYGDTLKTHVETQYVPV